MRCLLILLLPPRSVETGVKNGRVQLRKVARVFGLVAMVGLSAAALAQTSSHLLYKVDFEDGTYGPFVAQGKPARPIPQIQTEVVRSGKYAVRSFIDSGVSDRIQRERVEMKAQGSGMVTKPGEEYWYGWSVYLASPWPVDPSWGETLTQFHKSTDGGEPNPNPTLSFGFRPGSDDWVIANRSDPRAFSADKAGVITRSFSGGKIARDEWTDWVVNVKWSYKDDGFLKIWKNGELIVDSTGPNCSNDTYGPVFKMGVYKSAWRDGTPSSAVKTRLAYHDEFRMADAAGSYEDVAPPGPRDGAIKPKRPVTLVVN
jgi:Polysaccharide lyase